MTTHSIQSTSANEIFRVYDQYENYSDDRPDEPTPPDVTQVLTFNKGFGSDIIEVSVPISRSPTVTTLVHTQPYVIKLGAGITAADVELFAYEPYPLYVNSRFDTDYGLRWDLYIKGTNDLIKVIDFLPSGTLPATPKGLLGIEFADGSSWDATQVQSQLTVARGNDVLIGGPGNDSLVGRAGHDMLQGNGGRDTLAGGRGQDVLIGGKGNDTYLFGRGDGLDTIHDNDSTWFNSDKLKISDASSRQLWLTREGSDLLISVIGTQDSVRIDDWYASWANRVETISAGDGKTLTAGRVDALVSAMAAFSPPAMGEATLPANVASTLSKVLASSWR